MIGSQPRATRTAPIFPYTTLFRSGLAGVLNDEGQAPATGGKRRAQQKLNAALADLANITSGDRYSRSAAKGVGDFRRQFDSYHTVEDRRKVDGFHGLIPPVTLLQATRRVRAGMRTSGTAPPPMLKPLTSRAS